MTNAATNAPPIDMADMPVQLPATPNSEAEARARFFNSGNAFNVKLPRVPATRFTAEVEAAPRVRSQAERDLLRALRMVR